MLPGVLLERGIDKLEIVEKTLKGLSESSFFLPARESWGARPILLFEGETIGIRAALTRQGTPIFKPKRTPSEDKTRHLNLPRFAKRSPPRQRVREDESRDPHLRFRKRQQTVLHPFLEDV
jgi:hypothetical protein